MENYYNLFKRPGEKKPIDRLNRELRAIKAINKAKRISKRFFFLLIAGSLAWFSFQHANLRNKIEEEEAERSSKIEEKAEMSSYETLLERAKKDLRDIEYSKKKSLEEKIEKKFEVFGDIRGLYINASTAGTRELDNILDKITDLPAKGINSLVIDVKESGGVYYKDYPLEDIVKKLHEKNIYVIARQVVFKDSELARKKPALAIKSREGLYVNPSDNEAQKYNIDIAKDVARKGVDEIQFDYIRFPDDYSYNNDKKIEEINRFLEKAREEIKKENPKTKISVDIFGYVCWHKDIGIGQKLEDMAKYVDVICPMAYSSHYSPEHRKLGAYKLVRLTCEKAKERLEKVDNKTEIRPWIQGFTWRANFDENYILEQVKYILEQVKAAQDSGSTGFCIWNAKNVYKTSFAALKNLKEKAE